METTILITITMLLIGVSNLLIVAVLGITLLNHTASPKHKTTEKTTLLQQGPAPISIDKETLERKQREYQEQLMAINELMNYSSDIAYGITPKE